MPSPNRIITIVMGLLLSVSGCMHPVKQGSLRVHLTPPRIEPLQEAQWTEEQARILNASRIGGKLLNLSLTTARHPKMMESWNAFGRYVLTESKLPRRDREILILRIGWLTRSDYAFGQHTIVARWIGMSPEEIERITKGPDAPGWTPFESFLIRAADELHADAFITDGTWQGLSAVYNEKQLMDLVMTVGQYSTVCMLTKSLGVQREPGVPGFSVETQEKEKHP